MLLAVEQITIEGLVATYTAVTAEDSFVNDGETVIHVKNAHASVNNVTLISQKTVDGLDVEDPIVAVAATTEQFIGPFPKAIWNDLNRHVFFQSSNLVTNTVGILTIRN